MISRRLVAIAALAVVPAQAIFSQSVLTAAQPVLATSGQGEAKVTPDRASVLVNVVTRATTAATAGADNAQRTKAVLDALAKLGLSRDQLTTEGYSVYPEMKSTTRGHRLALLVTWLPIRFGQRPDVPNRLVRWLMLRLVLART